MTNCPSQEEAEESKAPNRTMSWMESQSQKKTDGKSYRWKSEQIKSV